MNKKQNVTILGATGSIGVSTLSVLKDHPERFQVFALTAHRQVERLYEQCLAFRPAFAVLHDAADAAALQQRLMQAGVATEVLAGEQGLCQVAALPETDTVMAAIVGAAGLKPALAAACAGKRLLLANKEALVMSGALFMAAVARHGARLLPIDSEHNAVFQSLPADFHRDLDAAGVRRIILTASGGPFRNTPLAALETVTPAQAVAHPNWSMGRKISVDSATMMNKGLEVIEAHWLFGAPADRIDVVIHPQSVIHSMVEYTDGSVIAQLGNPDMRTPIAHALGYPERITSGVSYLDLVKTGKLEFQAPDAGRFPCLDLAYQALQAGGTAPAMLNAANEVAVAAFLDGRLPYLAIPRLIAAVLERLPAGPAQHLDAVLAADRQARVAAQDWLASAATAG
jgi:1-deoxy-D-xylulose-5-phosphate reductoisomerase